MDEVAKRLHKSRRWLQDFIRVHPYYRLAGRTKLFTENDIICLIKALPYPSSSNRPAKADRRIGTSAARSSESLLIEARKLLTGTRRSMSSEDGNEKSPRGNIVPFQNGA